MTVIYFLSPPFSSDPDQSRKENGVWIQINRKLSLKLITSGKRTGNNTQNIHFHKSRIYCVYNRYNFCNPLPRRPFSTSIGAVNEAFRKKKIIIIIILVVIMSLSGDKEWSAGMLEIDKLIQFILNWYWSKLFWMDTEEECIYHSGCNEAKSSNQ